MYTFVQHDILRGFRQAGGRTVLPSDREERNIVSDQDFFFEEDEQPIETAQPVKNKRAVKQTTAASTETAGDGDGTVQTISMAVAVLIGVIALLAGVIIGILLPIGSGDAQPTAVPNAGSAAPQLTPEQLEGGDLPPGHPDIGGSPGATGSAPTTGN